MYKVFHVVRFVEYIMMNVVVIFGTDDVYVGKVKDIATFPFVMKDVADILVCVVYVAMFDGALSFERLS